MWKIHKYSTCEIIDEQTNRIVTSNLDEDKARLICEMHNKQMSQVKWGKEDMHND